MLGVIIGETTELSIVREKAFFLISVAYYRPYLQLACFQALRNASRLRGHLDVSDFLREYFE